MLADTNRQRVDQAESIIGIQARNVHHEMGLTWLGRYLQNLRATTQRISQRERFWSKMSTSGRFLGFWVIA